MFQYGYVNKTKMRLLKKTRQCPISAPDLRVLQRCQLHLYRDASHIAHHHALHWTAAIQKCLPALGSIRSLLETLHVGKQLTTYLSAGLEWECDNKTSEKSALIISKGREERREVCRCASDVRAPICIPPSLRPPALFYHPVWDLRNLSTSSTLLLFDILPTICVYVSTIYFL